MREKEMWQIVQRVLARTARKVAVPAALGLGLTLASCDGRPAGAGPGAADARTVDGQTTEVGPMPIAEYAAPFPASPSVYAAPQPEYAAPFPATRYAAPQPDADAVMRDGGPLPDLG